MIVDYYNDNDKSAVAWARELVRAGLVNPGDVDERSIAEVRPQDLAGYTQCHFFGGILGWPLALQLAGWPEEAEIFSGSCPCQPYSAAGKRKAHNDDRNLWPQFHRLIAESRPQSVVGEQVAGRLGLEWLAGVRADLEACGYAFAWAELCAAGVGAPHRRQRLYWCAHAKMRRRVKRPPVIGRVREGTGAKGSGFGLAERGEPVPLADSDGPERRTDGGGAENGGGARGKTAERPSRSGCDFVPLAESDGRQPGDGGVQRGGQHGQQSADGRTVSRADGVGNAHESGLPGCGSKRELGEGRKASETFRSDSTGPVADPQGQREGSLRRVSEGLGAECGGGAEFWAGADLVACRDGKVRRVPESRLQPVPSGLPDDLASVWAAIHSGYPLTDKRFKGRPALIRGAGNAITVQVAVRFIRAFMASIGV